MNIFKILASGDGNINEANVSAFLGYLLDPYADHGLGDELLSRILQEFRSSEMGESFPDNLLVDDEVVDLSPGSSFEVEILLEQAFKDDDNDKKQIVDIVVLIYQIKRQQKESIAKQILARENNRELKQIFLIENKIKTESAQKDQLKNQYSNTLETLKRLDLSKDKIENLISYIYMTPESDSVKSIFREFQNEVKNCPKFHLFWNLKASESEKQSKSLLQIMKGIVSESQLGEMEPIHEETVYLLRSFINFIQSDFRTRLEEKVTGKMIRDISYDFKQFSEDKKTIFSAKSFELLQKFHEYIESRYPILSQRHSTSHPISIFFANSLDQQKFKILSISRSGKGVYIQAVLRNTPQAELRLLELKDYLKRENFQYTEKERILFIRNENQEPISFEKLIRFFDFYWKFLKLEG
ncbi:hypothetical protein [Leptospira levettii]|uniref:hypothetical protein n=1 Tax=Leptospira levettii TaxID=2023178 RepID=UPI003EBC5251